MPKLRKQRRRKVFNHNRSRKRLRNKELSEGNINCKEIKSAWDSKKSMETNLKEMGLCYDPNNTFKITVTRDEKVKRSKKLLGTKDSNMENDWEVEDLSQLNEVRPLDSKKQVLEALIEDATAPRAKMLRLPKGQIEFLTEMLTKHGFDYKAMARDKKNYYQETWKQLRGKVKVFKSIPEQYDAFLGSASPETLEKLEKNVQLDEDD